MAFQSSVPKVPERLQLKYSQHLKDISRIGLESIVRLGGFIDCKDSHGHWRIAKII